MNKSVSAPVSTQLEASIGENLQTPWERAATTRWGQYLTEIERKAIMDAQLAAGPPAEALEVGCEGGRWSRLLADQGWKMTCIDVNPEALEACREKVPDARVVLTKPESRTIAAADNSFALTLCIEVAPVIQSDWFLPEAFRVLKPGGILLAMIWNKTSIRGLAHLFQSHSAGQEPTGFYRARYSDWRRELKKTGFHFLRDQGFCWGPFDRTSNSSLIPLFTNLEVLLGLRRLTVFSPWVICMAQKPKAA